MPKLSQILAVMKGVKSQSRSKVSELYKTIQKPDLFVGHSRTYQPINDGDERLPDEQKKIQVTVQGVLGEAEDIWHDLWHTTLRVDMANCEAKAPVVIDGVPVTPPLPAVTLLFLEKELAESVRTFLEALPQLDNAEDWDWDANAGQWRSREVRTHRTKKVEEPIVLYPATQEHPAQTAMITKDVLAGYWTTVKRSAGVPGPEKAALVKRAEKLLRAVKEARENANSVEESATPVAAGLLVRYLFHDEMQAVGQAQT